MFLSKVKSVPVALLALGLAGFAAGLVVHRIGAEPPPPKPVPKPLPPPRGEGQLPPPRGGLQEGRLNPAAEEPEAKPRPARTPEERAALLKARVRAAQVAYVGEWEALGHTRRFGNVLQMIGRPENVYTWSVRLLQAERAVSPKHEAQVAALEGHFKRMAELQKEVKRLQPDLMERFRVDEAEWYRLEAELWLAEAKAAK